MLYEDKEYQEQVVKLNKWHKIEELYPLMQLVISLITGKWSWARNMRCKYINIRIDMRDGGFVLLNRDRERLSTKDLQYQYEDPDYN